MVIWNGEVHLSAVLRIEKSELSLNPLKVKWNFTQLKINQPSFITFESLSVWEWRLLLKRMDRKLQFYESLTSCRPFIVTAREKTIITKGLTF